MIVERFLKKLHNLFFHVLKSIFCIFFMLIYIIKVDFS